MLHDDRHFLNDWRNDVGGHFLDAAAAYAVDNIHDDTVGVLELTRVGHGAEAKMSFAYELVAVAMTRRKGQQTEHQFLETAFTTMSQGFDASRDAIHAIGVGWLLGRFKR